MGAYADFDATLSAFVRIRPGRSVWRRLRDRVESFLASGNLSYERNFLFVRPAICAFVSLAVLLQGDLPGGGGVYIACAFATLYNFLFAYFIANRRIYMQRVSSLILDNLTVMLASLYVFHEMGEISFESDLWLIYVTLIVSNAMYYGPIGSTLFTTLWTGLFVFVSLNYYESGTNFRDQLPIRLVFFVLTGGVAVSLSMELRKRREGLEQKTRQTLTMLATIVEARDTDAGAHLRHIQHYSRALALHLGYDDATANEIAYAAMIHDVGKAQVSDTILKKPGPLTTGERREMQKHTIWGGDLLGENDEFVMACEVARSHHERWDGSGYPDGLAAEEIPIAARIVAVADIYDALVSERPYKAPWAPERAIGEIRALRGTHLDPAVVDAFVALFECGALRELERDMQDVARNEDEPLAA